MAFTHLFFDLDGTIIDSKRGIFNGIHYALDKMAIPLEGRPQDLNPFIGPPLRDSFKELFNFSSETAEKATALYREYYGDKGLYEYDIIDGIGNAILALNQHGKLMYVVTSKAEEYALKIIKSLPFGYCFKTVSGCEIDGRRSSKYELIVYTLNKHNLIPSEDIIMIGDRYHDIRGAKLTGISSAAVLYGYGSYEELYHESPTLFIEKPDQLTTLSGS